MGTVGFGIWLKDGFADDFEPCIDLSKCLLVVCIHLLLPHTEKRLLDEASDTVSSLLPKFIHEGRVHHWQGLAIASSAIPFLASISRS